MYDTYKDLYLCKDGREKKLLKENLSGNGMKVWFGSTRAGSTALTLTAEEKTVKRTLIKKFYIHLDFDFFNSPLYPYWVPEDPLVQDTAKEEDQLENWTSPTCQCEAWMSCLNNWILAIRRSIWYYSRWSDMSCI